MNKIVAVDCYLSHNLGDDLFLFTLLKRYPNVMFNVNAAMDILLMILTMLIW